MKKTTIPESGSGLRIRIRWHNRILIQSESVTIGWNKKSDEKKLELSYSDDPRLDGSCNAGNTAWRGRTGEETKMQCRNTAWRRSCNATTMHIGQPQAIDHHSWSRFSCVFVEFFVLNMCSISPSHGDSLVSAAPCIAVMHNRRRRFLTKSALSAHSVFFTGNAWGGGGDGKISNLRNNQPTLSRILPSFRSLNFFYTQGNLRGRQMKPCCVKYFKLSENIPRCKGSLTRDFRHQVFS